MQAAIHRKSSLQGVLQRLLIALAACMACTAAHAQYPVKPVKILVGFAPGGGIDIISRALGEKLQAGWGQPVIIENRPGASGLIAAEQLARAAPDGYTLMVTPSTVLTFAPALYEKLSFDIFQDFAPVVQLAASEVAYVVSASLPPAIQMGGWGLWMGAGSTTMSL